MVYKLVTCFDLPNCKLTFTHLDLLSSIYSTKLSCFFCDATINHKWLPSGEAFRISDLSRLESETLPQYFRHNRFQSLVRQLNFYNFRKINRERMFWVYHHPLFHRDRPEEMHKLRRRTCPGYDGRKNRSDDQDLSSSPPPDPSADYTWSNGDGMSEIQESEEGKDESTDGFAASPAAGIEVSRSPSPSNSPMDCAPAGRGSFPSSSARVSAFKLVVSEEERSPSDAKNACRRLSSLTTSFPDNAIVDSHQDFYPIDGEDVAMSEYCIPGRSSWTHHTDPLLAEEENDVNQLNDHRSASQDRGFTVTKKSRKAKQVLSVGSENEDDSPSSSQHFTRKKYSKEELQERQDHIQTVAEISRHLNGIAASMSEGNSRSRGKGRLGRLGATSGQAIRNTSASPVFGFDKPHDHYYGAGKCDLLTYDSGDGFVINEDNMGCSKEKIVVVPSLSLQEVQIAPVVTTPPSLCPSVNQSLTQACLEGKLVSSISTFDRTLASAILSFCLSTHPQDPDLATKIADHMKKRPMLAQEFEMYRKAMSPGVCVWGVVSASEDLKRDWKMFSMNFINHVVIRPPEHILLTAAELEAMVSCYSCWFKDVF